jgi:hypothetical protein
MTVIPALRRGSGGRRIINLTGTGKYSSETLSQSLKQKKNGKRKEAWGNSSSGRTFA